MLLVNLTMANNKKKNASSQPLNTSTNQSSSDTAANNNRRSRRSLNLAQQLLSPRRTRSSRQRQTASNDNITLEAIGAMIKTALDLQYGKIRDVITEKINELRDDLAEIESDLNDLQEDVDILNERVARCENENSVNVNAICAELNERRERARNILLLGFKDYQDAATDLSKVNEILLNLDEKPQAKFAFRLGKQIPEKIRPLKLVFDSVSTVNYIFKNRDFFVSRELKAVNDSTPLERNFLRDLRISLQKRIDEGETDLTIKFVKGIPSICKQKNVKKGNAPLATQ